MRAIIAVVLAAALAGCAPGLREPSPEHLALVQDLGGAYESPSLERYVQRVGEQVAQAARAGSVRVTILNDDTPNALSLPGGYVYVTRGLLALANSEAELAGVLAHEIAHLRARHADARVQQAIRDGLGLAVLDAMGADPQFSHAAELQALARLQRYSRDQEYQADLDGMRIMSDAGYDPRAMTTLMETLLRQDSLQSRLDGASAEGGAESDFLSSHPRTLDRYQRATAAVLALNRGGRLGREPYLRSINGLMYGDDPAHGIVRGNRYVHAGLGFGFEVPGDFAIIDDDDLVLAVHPTGALIIFDADAAPPGMPMRDYLAEAWLGGVELASLRPTAVNGMPAATAEMRINSNLGPMRGRAFAIHFDADTVYRFLLATPVAAPAAMARAQAGAATSFHRLSAAEAAAVQPSRLRTVTVPPQTPVGELAAASAQEDGMAERLSVLNGLAPGQPLPGGLVKTVTE